MDSEKGRVRWSEMMKGRRVALKECEGKGEK